jgi:uncharacterized membrane protein SpoIIM required for sporulation
MKECQFTAVRRADWAAWDLWLKQGRPSAAATIPPETLPRRFRALCQDLSLAHDRHYSDPLLDELRNRVLAVHQRLYSARPPEAQRRLRFILHDLPDLVRREARLALAAGLLFFLPLFTTLGLLQSYPEGVRFLLPPSTVAQMEEMYDPDTDSPGRPRHASDDVLMLGYYIAHNVQIDFQCFASGIAFGLGSVFFLFYNGLVIGAVAGHLTNLGYIETFWGFVAGHSAPELIGVVLSGMAGLKLGLALIAPGRLRRGAALRQAAWPAVRLLYGAAGLTFGAAFVEAFWSPLKAIPVGVKYGVGIVFWIVLLAYFALAGRERDGT